MSNLQDNERMQIRFSMAEDGLFKSDYSEEYKGHAFAVGLSVFGYYSVCILFKSGLDVLSKYLNIEDKEKSAELEKNWFVNSAVNILKCTGSDVIQVNKDPEQFMMSFSAIGYTGMNAKTKSIFYIEEEQFDKAAEKYKDVLKNNEKIRKEYNRYRNGHTVLSDCVRNKNWKLLTQYFPEYKNFYTISL